MDRVCYLLGEEPAHNRYKNVTSSALSLSDDEEEEEVEVPSAPPHSTIASMWPAEVDGQTEGRGRERDKEKRKGGGVETRKTVVGQLVT